MTTNGEVLTAAAERIGAAYIFPERGAEIVADLRRSASAGAYEGLTGAAFCEAVTVRLRESSRDEHLRLLWNEEPQALIEDEKAQEEAARAEFAALARSMNEGVRRVERLDGNVGYIDLRLVTEAGTAGPAVAAAMTLVRHTVALVLDLRENHGGAPSGAALWCGYMFADGEVHLNDVYEGETGRTRQFWSAGHVAGPRYPDRPLYVLTSGRTFSGAEDIAYTLQAQGRATVVGERTRGGAHPTTYYPLTPHVTVTVPTARAINPVTGTNWEGVGVVPDVEVPAAEALETARRAATTATTDASATLG